MKKNITISIDIDLCDKLQELQINVSSTINDLLRGFLKPKKVDLNKENLTLEIIKFGDKLGLTKEQSVFTHENLTLDATSIWNNFKDAHSPVFNLFDYMEIRNKFRKRFFENHEELNAVAVNDNKRN